MNIEQYYRQARAWQMDKEEKDRQEQIQRRNILKEAWGKARAEVLRAFPLGEIRIVEAEPGLQEAFPAAHHTYLCDVVLPGAPYSPVYDQARSMKGVIRVTLKYTGQDEFKAVCFQVWDEDGPKIYDTPYEAFLACCASIGFQPEQSG